MFNSTKLFQRALITNDDGYEAPGIHALERAAWLLAEEVWVVAPLEDASGTSAGLNLRKPLNTKQVGERKFALSGTPSDCILMACRHLMSGNLPTVIMTGINCGANLADDVIFSGTTNSALVGSFLGIPSIAFSLAYHSHDDLFWSAAEAMVPVVMHKIHAAGWTAGITFNVNFPAAPLEKISGIELSRLGGGSLLAVEVESSLNTIDDSQYRLGSTPKKRDPSSDTDIASLRRQAISITPLRLDRTDYDTLNNLRSRLSGTISQDVVSGN